MKKSETTKRAGSTKPRDGKCGARLRGSDAGRFCDAAPWKLSIRCRIHGGLTPRAAAAVGKNGDVFAEPFSVEERAEQERAEHDVAASLLEDIGELKVWMKRVSKRGDVHTLRQLGTLKANLTRAHALLQELPSADLVGPDVVEMYRATTAEELGKGPHIIERAASEAR